MYLNVSDHREMFVDGTQVAPGGSACGWQWDIIFFFATARCWLVCWIFFATAAQASTTKPSEQLTWSSPTAWNSIQSTQSAPQAAPNPFAALARDTGVASAESPAPNPIPPAAEAVAAAHAPVEARPPISSFATAPITEGRSGKSGTALLSRHSSVPRIDAPRVGSTPLGNIGVTASRSASGSLGRSSSQRKFSSVTLKPTSGVLDLGLVDTAQPTKGLHSSVSSPIPSPRTSPASSPFPAPVDQVRNAKDWLGLMALLPSVEGIHGWRMGTLHHGTSFVDSDLFQLREAYCLLTGN